MVGPNNTFFALAASVMLMLIATQPTRADEQKGISIWEGNNQYVRIVPRDGGEPNKLPVKLTKAQMKGIISRVGIADGDNEPNELMTKDEVDYVAEYITKALAAAGPSEDVITATIGYRKVLFSIKKLQIITLRIFADSAGLNIIVGDPFSDPPRNGAVYVKEDLRLFEYKEAHRATQVDDKASWKVAALEPGVIVKRHDWVVVPATLWTPPTIALPPEAAKAQQDMQTQLQQIQQQVQQLQKGGAVSSPAAPTAGFVPPASQAPMAAIPQPTPSLVAPTRPVEDRLKTLDDLKAKGLLTPDEYAAKRKHILDAL